jgi:hypothetical protein
MFYILKDLFLKYCILRPVLWMQYDFGEKLIDYFNTARRPAITAKRATPSTKAAVRIMFARMSLAASG